jgi:hypothetical protein
MTTLTSKVKNDRLGVPRTPVFVVDLGAVAGGNESVFHLDAARDDAGILNSWVLLVEILR